MCSSANKKAESPSPASQPAWYRARNYKGNLTEDEKRQLDIFRMQATHPAAQSTDLPEEVLSYISGLEIETYDQKQSALATRTLAMSGIGAALLILSFTETITPNIWTYVFGGLMLVAAWPIYIYEWKKNAEAFLPSDSGTLNATDEALRREWELEYIARKRKAEREAQELS